jgi:hypothetical protein
MVAVGEASDFVSVPTMITRAAGMRERSGRPYLTRWHPRFQFTARPQFRYPSGYILAASQPALRAAILGKNAALATCAAQTCRDIEDASVTAIEE